MNGYDFRRQPCTHKAVESCAWPPAKCIQPLYSLTSSERVSLRIQSSDGAATIVDTEGLFTAHAVVKVALSPDICIVLDGPDRKIVSHLGWCKHWPACPTPGRREFHLAGTDQSQLVALNHPLRTNSRYDGLVVEFHCLHLRITVPQSGVGHFSCRTRYAEFTWN
jgi:hypothetical protein